MKNLTHVLHQLQNKPWAAFYVACLFSALSNGVLLSTLFNRWHKQAGLQFCLE
jgi:hypothetical protein